MNYNQRYLVQFSFIKQQHDVTRIVFSFARASNLSDLPLSTSYLLRIQPTRSECFAAKDLLLTKCQTDPSG